MLWVQFIISAAIILVAGMRLTKYADLVSDALGLGKVWMGVILLGLVTSLPEAGSSIVSVAVLHSKDLAIGNMTGSNAFNLLLIVFLDIYYQKGAITNLVHYNRAHFLSAAFALSLAGVVAVEIILGNFIILPKFFGMSLGSFLVVVLYFWGMRKVYLSNPGIVILPSEQEKDVSLTKIYLGLVVSALFVVGGAVWLANSADMIAQSTGLGRTFVGSFFLAAATSLPELVVTISALKLGQIDLAIGNIFGSNMVNMFLLPICDLFISKEALLQNVSLTHVAMIAVAFIMTFVVLKGLKQSHKRKFLNIGWDSWTILVVYIAGIVGLYLLK